MSLRLGFDIDGVLANFRAAFRDAAVRIVRGRRRRVRSRRRAWQANRRSLPDDVRRVWDYIAQDAELVDGDRRA